MNEILDRLLDEARSAWRFRWIGLAMASLVALGGWFVVLSMPEEYEASASVFVDTRTALEPVLQGLIVEDDVMSQLGYVRQSILSGASLEKVALESGLLDEASAADPRAKAAVLAALSSQAGIYAEKASADAYQSSGTVYTFGYLSGDPDQAVRVIRTLLDTFISETLGGKQQSTEATQQFLTEQIKDYEDKLRDAENRLADFKKRNLGLLPTQQGGYFAQLQAEIDLATQTQNDLDVAIAGRDELARQLRGDSTGGGVGSVYQGSPDTTMRIRQAQARLDELLLRFTDRHPDVLEARRSLEELQTRRQSEVDSLRRGDVGSAAASGLAENPVFQDIQLKLNQADVQVASLRGKLGQHRAKAAELRQRLDTAPQVEAEYAQLNRDYDINKAQYTALLANYEKARLGERADMAAGMKFQLVQAPTASLVPAARNRGLLLVVVLAAALAAGGGLAYALHLVRPVVSSVRDLADLTELPVIGVVSPAFPQRLRAEARHTMLRFGLAAGMLLLAFATVLTLHGTGFRLASMAGGAG